MRKKLLVRLPGKQQIGKIGAKARNLNWLALHGYRVPRTFAIPYLEREEPFRLDERAKALLRDELRDVIDPGRNYAVRSSASMEDSPDHSFAGQFRSFLFVSGIEAVLAAVDSIYETAHSPQVQSYLENLGLARDSLHMAVILQEMVKPCVSGVAFSRNPLTGLDEVVVEAVEGSGEKLVQDGVTPVRWVYKWGGWTNQPQNSEIDIEIIRSVAVQAGEIARRYGAPVDLEWVYDGSQVYWVQLRPITRLNAVDIYSNRISREVFPGLIKPLIWSVNVPLVNGAWIQLFTELIGPNGLRPDDLARSFAYRAYFNMGAIGQIFTLLGFPRDLLELLLGLQGGDEKPRFRPTAKTFRHLPRMLAFAVRKLGLDAQVMAELRALRTEYTGMLLEDIALLDERQLLAHIDRLYAVNRRAAGLNIIIPLLMAAYHALLKRQLASAGIDITTFDLTAGLDELGDYDPNHHIERLAGHFNALSDARKTIVRTAALAGGPVIDPFSAEVEEFLNRFGHLSDSGNDFSATPWREDPGLVWKMIFTQADHTASSLLPADKRAGIFSHSTETASGKTCWGDLPLSPVKRRLLHPFYSKARRFRLYREAVSSTYTYGYGLFRVFFLALGRRLAVRGLILQPQDIFYLSWQEIRDLVERLTGHLNQQSPETIIAQRKAEMEESSGRMLPEIIYGNDLPPLQSPSGVVEKLKGIPSARGYYQGPARVIRTVADFHRLSPGDVLVIPYSDVSWTALFPRAGAVVAESGGILSHSSIVAREYNLPCVVSVPGACNLPDGAMIAVDGYLGEVSILEDQPVLGD